MPKPPQLTKLREWLTVEEAARYFSLVFAEVVSAADVLRAALDGHLRLSVRFVNHAYAKFAAPPLSAEQVEEIRRKFDEIATKAKRARAGGLPAPPPRGAPAETSPILTLDDTTVYDLPMVGAERLDVEHQFQRLTSGPGVTLINIDGTFVELPDGRRLQLHERAPSEIPTKDGPLKVTVDYIPTGGLPDDAVLVVRRKALEALVQRVSRSDHPVEKRQMKTLLTMLAAVCRLAKQDIQKPTRVATSIAAETERLGHPVSQRAVLDYLEQIRELYPEE